MADGMKQDKVSGLTAEDPRFDVMIGHRIEMMRGLRDLMALSSAELTRKARHSASGGTQIDDHVSALTNLRP